MLRPVPDVPARHACRLRHLRRGRLGRGRRPSARPCRCRRQRIDQAISGRLRGGIPRRMLGASLERHPDLEPTWSGTCVVSSVTSRPATEAGRGLWFRHCRRRPTTLALLVARGAPRRGRSVRIYSLPLLLAEMRNTFGADGDDTHLALFRRLAAVDLLVLDDLRSQGGRPGGCSSSSARWSTSWQDQRSIIVTSNTPDPYRDATLGTLRADRRAAPQASRPAPAAGNSGDRRPAGASRRSARGRGSCRTTPIRSLAAAAGRLQTVSRLIEICDDPRSWAPAASPRA